MNSVQKAIESITYRDVKFPEESFKIITENREEAVPFLRSAIEKAIRERDELDEAYQLHFYALFLLGEFQEKDTFRLIMDMLSLPKEVLDHLIGDAITEGVPDILYNVYDGNLTLLKECIQNSEIDEFIRAGLLRVMGQLYLDGILSEQEWKDFILLNIHDGREPDYLYNELISVICRCHFVDMLPEIRYLFDNDLADEIVFGKYEYCLDMMFDYDEWEKDFCESPIDAAGMLRSWSMFDEGTDDFEEDAATAKLNISLRDILGYETAKSEKKVKIQRNDPCPCGSGKKYKYCCLNKPKAAIDMIESEQERRKCLIRYPQISGERLDGRVYLEDYFDAESIEIDQLLYLGLMHRIRPIWLADKEKEKERSRKYLELAFTKFSEKIEKEQLKSFEQFDEKYSIHYMCRDWIPKLLDFLEENEQKEEYKRVKTFCKNMWKRK